jgi:hypothetical protein
MRTKVKRASPEVALTRILEGLGQELIDLPDEEIIEAAKALGMDPEMRGSAAFAGLKYPAQPQLSDFFEFEVCRKIQAAPERIGTDAPRNAKQKPKRPKRAGNPTVRKNPFGK